MMLQDPNTSAWLREALRTALERDPVDAANDAEMLRCVLMRRLGAALDAEAAIDGADRSQDLVTATATLTAAPDRGPA